MKRWISALAGAAAVGCGAFGAHGLKGILSPEALAVWNTGAHYHLIHAVLLAVLASSVSFDRSGDRARDQAWSILLGGVVLFSGSLYVLALTGIRWVGAVTPVGGVLLMAGWLRWGWGMWRANRSE